MSNDFISTEPRPRETGHQSQLGGYYDAQPGVIMGAIGFVFGGLFLHIPALVMGMRGRKVRDAGGTERGANASFWLGILGIAWDFTIGLLLWILLLGALGLASLGTQVDQFDASPAPADAPAAASSPDGSGSDNATITQCDDHPNEFIGGRAFVEVTNSTNRPRTYSVQVDFLDAAGTVIDRGSSFANDVAPGSTTRVEVSSLSSQDAPATCQIASVDSF